ncbi:MAG TPA: hypothetical protein VJ250_00835, partial [Nitrososphaeraceae archaeon]|nr:hypothetical protein [Nitrososphaeraceae archaeon]
SIRKKVKNLSSLSCLKGIGLLFYYLLSFQSAARVHKRRRLRRKALNICYITQYLLGNSEKYS